MKTKAIIIVMLLLAGSITFGQGNVGAVIRLKDGSSIDVHHFGRLECESNPYANTYTILRGKYYDSHTEIKDYSDISQLILAGFNDPPVASTGNQKATITAIKKDGVKVVLEDAELVMSCFGPNDKHNMIRVQIINPLTNEAVDLAIEMRNIELITFK